MLQGLIDGRVEPELFTTKLQKELNSSPQVDKHLTSNLEVRAFEQKKCLFAFQLFQNIQTSLLTALPGTLPEEVSSVSTAVFGHEGAHHRRCQPSKCFTGIVKSQSSYLNANLILNLRNVQQYVLKVGKLPPAMSVAGISAPSASLPIQVIRLFSKINL